MKTDLVRATPKKPMNKTEAAWAGELEILRRTGQIQWYAFEPMRLILANGCSYTPDFVMVTDDGRLQIDEVKGFWRDDARVKIKVAARLFPYFQFRAVKRGKKNGPRWLIEEIAP